MQHDACWAETHFHRGVLEYSNWHENTPRRGRMQLSVAIICPFPSGLLNRAFSTAQRESCPDIRVVHVEYVGRPSGTGWHVMRIPASVFLLMACWFLLWTTQESIGTIARLPANPDQRRVFHCFGIRPECSRPKHLKAAHRELEKSIFYVVGKAVEHANAVGKAGTDLYS